MEHRDKIREDNPGKSPVQIELKLKEIWNGLSEEERVMYNRSDKPLYQPEEDNKLITEAFRNWFVEHVFLPTRPTGSSDTNYGRHVVNKYIKNVCGPILKYSILHGCFQFPPLPASPNKNMYVEYCVSITNLSHQQTYPYYHPWKNKTLEFRVHHITYSDTRNLTVHMPGYG